MHNVIKSHAKAYRLYRKKYHKTQQGKVSITTDSKFAYPNANKTNSENEGAELVERFMQFQVIFIY